MRSISLFWLCALIVACRPAIEVIAPIGPEAVTPTIVQPVLTPITSYQSDNTDALALLVQDENSSWLGLVHGLRSIGVPVAVTTSPDEALRHQVVMVYPALTGSNSGAETLQALAAHVRAGNTLIAFSVIGGGMPDLFGFSETIEHAQRNRIEFQTNGLTRQFIQDAIDAEILLANPNDSTSAIPGVSYDGTKHPPVATYEDGTAAIAYNFFEQDDTTGHAYAIGLDFGHFILRAHNGRFTGRARSYVNSYQPVIDTLLRFLSAAYRQGEDDAIVLHPAPYNKEFTALITHDVDFTQSLVNTVNYAEFELQQGIPATYFIQTKYVRDYNDDAFLVSANLPILEELAGQGLIEIASHTVAHSNEFRNMPLGDGSEIYPEYLPFVQDFSTVRDATVLGELRISKYLLEHFSGQTVQTFRPGHLSLPDNLPEALEATGYQFSSSITANQALTHLPYRLMHGRGYDAETGVFEFPVTIEDEQGRLGDRIDAAKAVATRIGSYGGLVNIMIHTDVMDHKLEFEREFIDEFRDVAHFDTVAGFGNWWRARDQIEWRLEKPAANRRILNIHTESEVQGLTLQIPANWLYAEGLMDTTQVGDRLVLGSFNDELALSFTLSE